MSLLIKLPQISGYVKDFDSNKTMSFKVKNYLKCKTKYGKKLAVKWIKNLTVSVFIVIQKDKKK